MADYYQAVKQGIVIEDGEVVDYRGAEDGYDDGSTENEAIRCRNCGNEVEVYGTFQLIPLEVPFQFGQALAATEAERKQEFLIKIGELLGWQIPDEARSTP